MIFLDTDIISYYFNANTIIRDKIIGVIDSGDNVCMTVINVYEILRGFKWKNNKKKEDIFTIDNDVINIASSIYAKLRINGKTIGDADILIAAIVMKNKGILVSNNIKHYENIDGLELVNWST